LNGADSNARLARLLAAFCAWTIRHPWWVLAGSAVATTLAFYLSWSRLHFRTQRDDLMSADKSCQVRWRAYLDEFGADDDIVFVVEGGDRARMELAVDALAVELHAAPTRFDRVFYSVDLRSFRDRAVLFLASDEIRAIEAHLDNQALLFGPTAIVAWQGLTLENVLARAETLIEMQRRGEAMRESDLAFLRQVAAILSSAEKWIRGSKSFQSPWASDGRSANQLQALERPRYFFSDDGSLAILLARPANPDRQSFTPAAEAIGDAQEIVARVRGRFPDFQFGLTGLPVLEHEEMAGTDRDSMWAAWLALAGVAVLYFFVYRGLRYPLLTVGSLAAGTIWALGLTAVTVGHLNILSSAFAVMLIGMGDYGVLWVARFDEERRAGLDFDEAIRRTAVHAGPSILTAALSTSLAFYATMLADFQAVSELGFIAGSGVLLCALACLLLIPAVQAVLSRRNPTLAPIASLALANSARPWLPYATRRPSLVIAVAVAVSLLSIPFATGIRYDDNLLHLQSSETEAVHWEMKLLQRTGGTGWSALSTTDSPEEAIALRKKYEQLPEVARAEEIASLVPGDQKYKLPLLERIAERLKSLPPRGQAIVHPPSSIELLRQRVDAVDGHLDGEPALLDAARGFREALSETPGAQARLDSFNRELSGSLWDDLDALRQTASARPIGQEDLPTALRQRFIGKTGRWLVRASAKQDVWDNDALGRFVAQTRTVDAQATGKPFGTYEGLRSLKHGFLWAGLYALLAIVTVLVIDFRKTRDVLLGLLPLALGAVISLALLRLFNVPLNPANLIVLPLIVGVGVDNGVHILHDYRSKPHGEPYRMSAAAGRGILVAALTTILGFGTLMISRHQGIRSLGFALALAVTCCMIAALFVLPAVLCMLDRRRIRSVREVKPALRRAA
jgi:hopanoid biosynthesis associated RND transporter like protein HpnN